jgi:hypothetical protein
MTRNDNYGSSCREKLNKTHGKVDTKNVGVGVGLGGNLKKMNKRKGSKSVKSSDIFVPSKREDDAKKKSEMGKKWCGFLLRRKF